MPFVLCKHMNYKVLQARSAITAGFCIQSARESDVVSNSFPCAFLLESSPSSQDTTGRSRKTQSILVKSEVLPPFCRKEWGLWLSCSASSNGPCRRQNPTRAATTTSSQGSFTPKEGANCNGFSTAGACHLQCTYQKIFILHPKHALPLRQSKKVSNGTDTKMIKMIFFQRQLFDM